MRPTAGDPRGGVRGRGATLGLATMLPGLMLVIVIFWALAAVLMLTGTLINAREIEDTVEVINGEVSSTDGIDKDLDSVKELEQTRRTVASIRDAADPLTGQADQIITAADGDQPECEIDSQHGRLDQHHREVDQLDRPVDQRLRQLDRGERRTDQSEGEFDRGQRDLDQQPREVDLRSGRAGRGDRLDVDQCLGHADPAGAPRGNANVVTIDRGAAAINGRADRAINLARGIKSDFEGSSERCRQDRCACQFDRLRGVAEHRRSDDRLQPVGSHG